MTFCVLTIDCISKTRAMTMVNRKRSKYDKELDYGDVADKLAADEQERQSDAESDDGQAGDSYDDDDAAQEEHDGSSNEEEEDVGDEPVQDDIAESDEEFASSGEDDVEDEGITEKAVSRSDVKSTEPCTFDVRNLLAMNSHGVNEGKLYKSKSVKNDDRRFTIEAENFHMTVDEDYLLQKATDGCSQLLSVLWQLPVERSDAGPLGTLPKYDELPLPRSLAPPALKQLTKWEKFAKEKGLPLNKSKRSQKVWDEATNSWKYRHGYEKANDDTKEWPIMEVKANQDPFEDPWERARDEKKSRREHNQESRMKNMERAGALPKGTAKSVVKQRTSAREVGKIGGNKDRDTVPPAGVPVDLKASKDGTLAKRGKASTLAALLATQKSTASLGRFDKMLEGEPARKKALASANKRKYESDSDKKVLSTESERSMKVLKSVVEGGGVAKEKARRKGQLAHGETGYDYDYDDGLGGSSFRKKKGRAGVGKAKKMTKKRIK
ncbi:hypothetical protein MPSEU_000478100 [Mayamaea pseudoterrestris]|nr:hypothetical protein MPSEU_000478100 [Mayamaea pseudoterrestris]